jgi:uncharacterized protein YdhG (YjbR/CyaY superfamily)
LIVADVDGYIAAAPKVAQPTLRELRQLIRAAAPKAEERISYGMPFYAYHGRLVYFACHKNHVGLYAIIKAKDMYAKELQRYLAGQSTLQFRIGPPLPGALIRKVVKARVEENEALGKNA